MNISIYGVSELWLVIYVYVCICVYHLCAAQINSMDFRSAYNYNFFLQKPFFDQQYIWMKWVENSILCKSHDFIKMPCESTSTIYSKINTSCVKCNRNEQRFLKSHLSSFGGFLICYSIFLVSFFI